MQKNDFHFDFRKIQRWEELTLEENYYKKKFRKYEFIDYILGTHSFSVDTKIYPRQNFFMRYINDPEFREEKRKNVIMTDYIRSSRKIPENHNKSYEKSDESDIDSF